MAWRRSSGNPLSGPMMVRLPTHICVTRTQWVKRAILGNCSQMNATKHISWWVNIASNNGLLSSGINPFPEPMLTYIYVATRPSWMKMCLLITLLNELMFWRKYMSDSLITVHIWQILPQLKLRNSVFCMFLLSSWASYQIRKIAGCACAGNAGNVFPRRRFQRKLLVSDPGMHHGTCVTHVPWCMSGSLTCGDGENVPGIPGACAPAILRIWQEAHGMKNPYPTC